MKIKKHTDDLLVLEDSTFWRPLMSVIISLLFLIIFVPLILIDGRYFLLIFMLIFVAELVISSYFFRKTSTILEKKQRKASIIIKEVFKTEQKNVSFDEIQKVVFERKIFPSSFFFRKDRSGIIYYFLKNNGEKLYLTTNSPVYYLFTHSFLNYIYDDVARSGRSNTEPLVYENGEKVAEFLNKPFEVKDALKEWRELGKNY